MNVYIPVLDQQPTPGWICNVMLRHVGPSEVQGHTPPRSMPIVCPCVECFAERLDAILVESDIGDPLEEIVLGPMWFGHDDPGADPADYVGLYMRPYMENK